MNPLTMTPLRALKQAFDAIPEDQVLTAGVLGELIADYEVAANKPDISDISYQVATRRSAYGVTTYGDVHALSARAIRRFGA